MCELYNFQFVQVLILYILTVLVHHKWHIDVNLNGIVFLLTSLLSVQDTKLSEVSWPRLTSGQMRWLVITLQVLTMSKVIILDKPTLSKICYNVFVKEHVYMYMYHTYTYIYTL